VPFAPAGLPVFAHGPSACALGYFLPRPCADWAISSASPRPDADGLTETICGAFRPCGAPGICTQSQRLRAGLFSGDPPDRIAIGPLRCTDMAPGRTESRSGSPLRFGLFPSRNQQVPVKGLFQAVATIESGKLAAVKAFRPRGWLPDACGNRICQPTGPEPSRQPPRTI
jgi:hypothetical protein